MKRVLGLGLILVLILSSLASAQTYEADVVVIGGGGAGLAAAVSAAENGASVILIEKAPFLGGNTLLSGGAYNAVDPGRQSKTPMNAALLAELRSFLDEDPADYGDFGPTLVTLQGQIREYLESGNTDYLFDTVELHMIQTYLGGKRTDQNGYTITGNYELVRTLCENALPALEWLEGYGMQVADEISTVLGALWPRTHGVNGGAAFIETLYKAAQQFGVQIMLNTKGTELIAENGRVVGVKAEQGGNTITLRAKKGVVIATGGYGENPEMRAQYNTYWKEMPLTMPSTNSPYINGDGILMAQAVGANLTGMGFIQLMPSSHPVTGSLFTGVWGSAETQVFVNKQGKRFVNEYAERDVLAGAALEQEDALFFIICDAQIVGNRDIQQMLDNGDVIKADTLEELAVKLGIDPATFVAEIEKYNSYVDQQYDPDFGKTNFGNYKVEVAPFYATPRSPAVHHTMGGLEIDTLARVISVDGEPIPGLYAAGEVTGGIHAGNRLGGNALADVIVFGRIAGESAALTK